MPLSAVEGQQGEKKPPLGHETRPFESLEAPGERGVAAAGLGTAYATGAGGACGAWGGETTLGGPFRVAEELQKGRSGPKERGSHLRA